MLFPLLAIRGQAGCLCAAIITSAVFASSAQHRQAQSSEALTWDNSHLCHQAKLDLHQRPVACAGSDPNSRDQYNSPRHRSNQCVSTSSPALESSRESPCTGQLQKEGPLCSRDAPQCCTWSMEAAQKPSASPTATLGYPIHVGSRIHSLFGCRGGFSSCRIAASIRRMTARKHAGVPAQHIQRGQPLQTPDSDKGYGRARKQSGLVSSSASCQRAPPGLRFAVPLHPIR